MKENTRNLSYLTERLITSPIARSQPQDSTYENFDHRHSGDQTLPAQRTALRCSWGRGSLICTHMVPIPICYVQGCLFPGDIRVTLDDAQKIKQALQPHDFHSWCCLKAREAFKGKTEGRKENSKRNGAERAVEDLRRMSVLTQSVCFNLYQIVLSKHVTVYNFSQIFLLWCFANITSKSSFSPLHLSNHMQLPRASKWMFMFRIPAVKKNTTWICLGSCLGFGGGFFWFFGWLVGFGFLNYDDLLTSRRAYLRI